MIVEIEKPNPTCRIALDYNENKVMRDVAELIGYANLPGSSHDVIYETFDMYEKGMKYPIKQVSFHASINPSSDDECTQEQILDLASGVMKHLGYGDQPFLVYRHFDIDRDHYHIVSIRVDKDGRKIKNLYDYKRMREYMQSIAESHGFSLTEKGRAVRQTKNLKDPVSSIKMRRFKPSAPVAEQLKEIFNGALAYDFDGHEQMCRVLESYGVKAEVRTSDVGLYFALQGLDEKGLAVTEVFSEMMLGVPMYEQCMMASIANKQRHHVRRREKERLRGLVDSAFKYSKSESHFENILRNKGVDVFYSRNVNDEVFGITFVDHRTRSVFKASEISDVISVGMMKQAVDGGRWRKEDRGGKRVTFMQEKRRMARKETIALRDIKVGTIARVLTPVGQPHGNSWSNKPKESEQQKADERNLQRSGTRSVDLQDNRLVTKIE